MRTIKAVDLFCGAGGSSTGLKRITDALGLRLDLTAVNHWPIAVATHASNHPEARHVCESLDSIDPRKVTGGSLDVLWASPECTHHSTARGGKPINDQSRSTAWCVTRWAEALRPRWIIVENVPEFQTWGPIGSNDRPLQSRKGETFTAWANALRSLGYTVEARVLNSADYGAATTRRRLFVTARLDGGARGRGPIDWPSPTHAPAGTSPLFGDLKPWRAAREIIDWDERGTSIFQRKKDLAPRTMERIAAGARKFWGVELEPFIVAMEHGGRELSIDKPLPTITTAKGGAFGLVQPFVLGQQSGAAPRGVSDPTPTLATSGAVSLVEPFLVSFYGSGVNVSSVREPLRTLTTHDRHGLVTPTHLDVTFRMLRLHEASAAMGFPADYQFSGTRADGMKQVGNAVEVNQAAALWAAPVAQVAARRAA
jgi:DNA (cytosine-5)-methyltransferase 1